MEKNVYRITNSILPACIILLCLHDRMGIADLTWYHLGLSLMVIAGLTAFCYMKWKGRLFMGISVVASLGVIWFVFGAERIADFWGSYVLGIRGKSSEMMPWGTLQESLQVLWISLGAFFLHLLTEKLFGVKLFMAAGLLAALFGDMFSKKGMEHISVVCILLYVIIVFVEWTQRHWNKQKKEQRKQYVVWLLPFLAVYFLLMAAMPAPKDPYDWKLVKDTYNRLRDYFIVFSQNVLDGDREQFQTAFSGFSGEGKLLGGLTDANKELIHVQGYLNLKTNVYLTGKVYDTFTGNQWLQESESTVCDRELDALETAYAIQLYDEEYERNYMQSTRLNISYRYFNTGYLFAPLKAYATNGKTPYSTKGGNLLLEEKLGYGTEYTVDYFQLNVDHQQFYEFLDAAHGQDEMVWKRLQRLYLQDGQEHYSLEDLEVHREDIYRIYGLCPMLSDKTRNYLEEVTKEAVTTVEKLKSIEAALRELSYTKTPGGLPEAVTSETEFLDYFLFESKEGFCSYFASAFVLLARAEGIPARYVEGFCVPMENQEATVYSGMAHAWPEVYIDGVGWIPFEPTPGYESIRYTPWEMIVRDKQQVVNPVDLSEDEEEEEETVEGDLVPEEEAQSDRSVLKVILYSLLFIGLAGCVIYMMDGWLAGRRYAKLSPEKKMLVELQRNVQLLAMLGYPRGEAETLEELAQRAWAVMKYEDGIQGEQLQFLRLYEDVVYGNYPVSEEVLETVLKERQILLELLKKWKRFAYIYCKISGRY